MKEVPLYGTADLGYWAERLRPEGLYAYADHGRAELLLIAAAMTWMGVRFSELSISVAVAEAPGAGQRAGMFLAQAFNSVGWFAWVERVLFQAPYDPGLTQVTIGPPASFALTVSGTTALRVAVSTSTPLRWRGPAAGEGAVFLPRRLSRTAWSEKLFFAQLSGETEVYPFVAGGDVLEFGPPAQALVESSFAGREWQVRAEATHKKSATYARQTLAGGVRPYAAGG